MTHAQGVLPEGPAGKIIRDPRSDAFFVFVDLQPQLDAAGLQAWLQRLTELVADLQRELPHGRVAEAAVGLGPSFFSPNGSLRAGLSPEQVPVGLRAVPTVNPIADAAAGVHDVVLYIMSTSEAALAKFLLALDGTRPQGLLRVQVERGYQRDDRREHFGFLDGLRNPSRADRAEIVFVDLDVLPEEPASCDGGSYLAYMKIQQHLDLMAQKTQDEAEQLMGRRMKDGSRLDLAPGTNPHTEGDFGSPDTPARNAHVRKSGPRGEIHDEVRIFRRGVPYVETEPDGTVAAGLQFASFQDSLEDFAVIVNRWMTNPAFPDQQTGVDRLFQDGLVTILKAGFYFVPPADERFIAASLFDPPKVPPHPHGSGRVYIRKRMLDSSGNPILGELGGIQFQISRQSDGQPLGDPFHTNPAGRAISGDLPLNEPLTIQELNPPTNVQAPAPVPITLTERRTIVGIDNRAVGSITGYGG